MTDSYQGMKTKLDLQAPRPGGFSSEETHAGIADPDPRLEATLLAQSGDAPSAETGEEAGEEAGKEAAAASAEPATTPSGLGDIQRFMGEFRLLERLGKGGMGDVFLAQRDSDGVQVALKVLTADMDHETTRARFGREGKVLLELEHPTIVRLVARGVDEETRRPYLAMELVPGRDLGVILKERDPQRLSWEEATYVLERCAQALRAAHQHGVIHRDVKPSNILVTPAGEVKLTDFGIALTEDASVRLTMGALVGTPSYLAPEVLLGEPWSPAADLYALGSLAFEVLSGKPLFDGGTTTGILADQITREPPDLKKIADSPPWLSELAMALLRKDPNERLTVDQVIDELTAHLPPTEKLESLRRGAALDRERQPLQLSGGRVLRQGQVFHHYRIDEELGRGGMGIVFKALHLGIKRPVALKVLAAGALATPDDQQRFLREAEAAGALSHSAIVPVLDAGQHDGTYYLAMEYVEGQPLSACFTPDVSQRSLLQLFCELCAAVSHAHTRGVIHRDLKPDNILVDPEGHPHVLDFGVARRVDEQDESKDLAVGEGVVGTLRYMSPEQAAGQHHVDMRSDVYSLGAILYEGLAGRTPHVGNVQELFYLLHIGVVSPPSKHRDELPWELDAICLKALERDPDDRYQSALELGREVERFLEGEPIQARKATFAYRARKYVLRNKGRVAAAAAMFVVVSALIGLWVASVLETRRVQEQAARDRAANERRQAEEAVARRQALRDRVRAASRSAWAHFRQGDPAQAANEFEGAAALAPVDELIKPSPADLEGIPALAMAEVPAGERAELRLSRDRLRRWAAFARERAARKEIERLIATAKAAVDAGELERASRDVLAASELGGREEARPISKAIAEAYVRRAKRELDAGLDETGDLGARRARLEQARRELEEAQRVVARVAQAELGQVLQELGKLGELEQAQAVERERKARSAELVLSAQALLEAKDLAGARRAFEQALGADGQSRPAREGLLAVERSLRAEEEERARAAKAKEAATFRARAQASLAAGRKLYGLGEAPETVRSRYFDAFEDLRRSALVLPDAPELKPLRETIAREFAAVLVDQGQVELARFVRRLGGLSERDTQPVQLPQDPHLTVVETVTASARAAYSSQVVFQRTRAFDSLRAYVASQARALGVRLRFDLRILGTVARTRLGAQVYFTGIEIRMFNETRNTLSPPVRVMAEGKFLRPAAVDTLGRRVFRSFKNAQRLRAAPLVKRVEGIVQRMVRDAPR